ncbi:MAG: hypothetical protein HKN82_06570, partial [Akkermansiaceae bacterium]|nr:hypothetical protein [Akkermansiaceae bacterium]
MKSKRVQKPAGDGEAPLPSATKADPAPANPRAGDGRDAASVHPASARGDRNRARATADDLRGGTAAEPPPPPPTK